VCCWLGRAATGSGVVCVMRSAGGFGDVVAECFCGQLVAHLDGWVHIETGVRECFPDEPETDDQALPVL
jgi:hypothetical protein